MDQAALDEDLEGSPAAFAQAHRCAALDAQSVRKTCGAGGIAGSGAAVGYVHEHGWSSVSVGLVNTGDIPYA